MHLLKLFLLLNVAAFLGACGNDESNASLATSSETTTPTATNKIYAFQTNIRYTPSDLKANAGTFSNICSNAFSTYSASVSCTNFYPFLGKSSTNGFKSFISANGLNSSDIVKLIDGSTTVASTLQALIENGPNLKNNDTWTGWSEDYWFSGVATDASSGNNCQNYTSDASSNTISIGTNGTSFSWVNKNEICDYYDDYPFICLCN